jgi:hypothetical protein
MRILQTADEIEAMADAMAQLLDDMGAHDLNRSVCLAAKAQARIAYEPFRDPTDDDSWLMPLDRARTVLKECDG